MSGVAPDEAVSRHSSINCRRLTSWPSFGTVKGWPSTYEPSEDDFLVNIPGHFVIGPPATPIDYSSSVDRGRGYLFGTQRTTKTGKRRTGFFILCRKFCVETVLILGVFALQLLPDLTKLLDLVRQPEGPVREVSAGVGVTDMNVHSSLPVTLQPNRSLGFSRASFLRSPFLGSSHPSFLTFVILQGPLTQNVKCSLNITNPNADSVSFKIKTTAPKVRPSRVGTQARLIYIHSCTAYGPTPE